VALIISTPGKRYKYRSLEFWAERGLIHVFDFRNNPYEPDYTKRTVRDWLLLADRESEGLKRMKYSDEREERQNFIENIVRVCNDAKRQGRPDDPKTWDHIRKMRDKRVLYAGPSVQAGNYYKGDEK
jgi:hypothetical protein